MSNYLGSVLETFMRWSPCLCVQERYSKETFSLKNEEKKLKTIAKQNFQNLMISNPYSFKLSKGLEQNSELRQIKSNELKVTTAFETIKKHQVLLTNFLINMPKGGELHNHLTGAIYAEDYLKFAEEEGLYYDPKDKLFYKQQCQKDRIKSSDLRLKKHEHIVAGIIDSISMRNFPETGSNGHDHFFQAFDIIESLTNHIPFDKLLVPVLKNSLDQNLSYQELMVEFKNNYIPNGFHDFYTKHVKKTKDYNLALKEILNSIQPFIEEVKKKLDLCDQKVHKELGTHVPITDPNSPIFVRYIAEIDRTQEESLFFADIAAAIILTKLDKRIVGINIDGPEDNLRSDENFGSHMEILDYLWKHYHKPNITLHSGELSPKFAKFDSMRSRIKDCLDNHASRISHCSAIKYQERLGSVIRDMYKNKIAVEICPTSNKFIIGAYEETLNFFLLANVPVVIGTDDAGVNRTTISDEFVKVVNALENTHCDSYLILKNLMRNSIEFSFIEGESIYQVGYPDYHLKPEFKNWYAKNWTPSDAAKETLDRSNKAKLQLRLEKQFVQFEKDFKIENSLPTIILSRF